MVIKFGGLSRLFHHAVLDCGDLIICLYDVVCHGSRSLVTFMKCKCNEILVICCVAQI